MADLREPDDPIPSERDVARVLALATGRRAVDVRRFTTGLAHYVFDVRTDDGGSCVVRMSRPDLRRLYDGCLYWHRRLHPLGVPLPTILFADAGAACGFPTVVMERLPGDDLGAVYADLSTEQRRTLAGRVAAIQGIVRGLPPASGFGYATSYEEAPLLPRWSGVVTRELARARRRLREAGIVEPSIVDGVAAAVADHAVYFAHVEPIPFLDDLTTKNVIVAEGQLAGIVDVDMVCFGDPLRTPALTYVALTSLGQIPDYVEYWLDLLALAPDQQRAFEVYVAKYCVDVLSEIGHRFNQDAPIVVDEARVERLLMLRRRFVPE